MVAHIALINHPAARSHDGKEGRIQILHLENDHALHVRGSGFLTRGNRETARLAGDCIHLFPSLNAGSLNIAA